MTRHIVVTFRMPHAGMAPGPEGTYMLRARSMCARGEALGGRLVAWGASVLALAYDEDSMEEAVLFATSIREEALSLDRAWACGVAEGELEALAPDGDRMHLAWGEALLNAASLARIAKAGEVLVDGDVRALRAGQLSLIGARAATDSGQRVRGWRLDLEHPWKRVEPVAGRNPDVTDRFVLPRDAMLDAGATLELPVPDFSGDELSTSEVLQIVEAASMPSNAPEGPVSSEQGSALAAKVMVLARGDENADAVEALGQLRRMRAEAEAGPAPARCQAALALAMALTLSGRIEEGLLEALDALARARESHDDKAVGACLALLAKLYTGASRPGEAAVLRESAGLPG